MKMGCVDRSGRNGDVAWDRRKVSSASAKSSAQTPGVSRQLRPLSPLTLFGLRAGENETNTKPNRYFSFQHRLGHPPLIHFPSSISSTPDWPSQSSSDEDEDGEDRSHGACLCFTEQHSMSRTSASHEEGHQSQAPRASPHMRK